MWIYLIIIAWIVFMEFLYLKTHKEQTIEKQTRKKWKYSIATSFPIFFIMAFRASNIGNDTIGYIRQFNELKKINFDEMLNADFSLFGRLRTEKGYLVFSKVISLISGNEIFFLAVVSFILLICVVRFLVINTDDPVLGIFLFFTIGLFSFMMTGIRQSLAMSICLLAFEEAKKRHLIRFLLLIFLAFSFHKSSIIFVIVYFMVNQKLTIIKTFLLFVATFVLIRYLEPIQNLFNETLDYDYSIEKTGNGQMFLIIMVALLVFTLYKYRENVNQNKDMLVLYNMQILCVILWILRLFTRTVERPSYYFMFAILVLIPNSINKWIKQSNRRIITIVLIVLFSVLFIYRTAGDPMFNPYNFVWNLK